MARVAVFIDGFNLYHALDFIPNTRRYPNQNPHRYRKYKWLDLAALAGSYIYNKNDLLVGTYYFTTYAHWDTTKVAKHRNYVAALESQGVKVIEGKFKEKRIRCRGTCGDKFVTFEEKQTDVNIALTMLRLAIEGFYDKAIIVSADTDLIPAIKFVKEMRPSIQVGVVLPIGRTSNEILKYADFKFQMKESHLKGALLPDPYILSDGSQLLCPPSWK